jgi:hypothetical protein
MRARDSISLGCVVLFQCAACQTAVAGQIPLKQHVSGVVTLVSISGANVIGFADPGAVEAAAATPQPPHFRGPAGLDSLLERTWRVSPTFRRQCARLAETSVTVIVRVVGPRRLRGLSAMTRITRSDGLARHADVFLGALTPELLAHELEHVLEQIDGIDLSSLEAHAVHGVQKDQWDRFETTRAFRIGQIVADEVSRKAVTSPLPTPGAATRPPTSSTGG